LKIKVSKKIGEKNSITATKTMKKLRD